MKQEKNLPQILGIYYRLLTVAFLAGSYCIPGDAAADTRNPGHTGGDGHGKITVQGGTRSIQTLLNIQRGVDWQKVCAKVCAKLPVICIQQGS